MAWEVEAALKKMKNGKEALESIFRRLNWEHKGVKRDEEFLSNLRFADDIFLCTETPQELYNRCYKNYPMKVGECVLR